MPNRLRKLISFVRAVTSGRDPKLQAQRDAICQDCDQFHERPVKSIWGKWIMQAYCKACGCGSNPMANIRGGKNGFVKLSCPLWKWPGDAEGKGLTLRDANALHGARDRLESSLATVQSLIDRGKPMSPEVLAQVYGQQIANQVAQNNAKRQAAQTKPQAAARAPAKACCKEQAPRTSASSVEPRNSPVQIPAAITNRTQNLLGAGV